MEGLELCELEPVHEEISLAVDPGAISGSARMAVEELNLVHLKAKFAKQKVLKISRSAFIQAATIRVLQVASKYLSDDVHFDKVSEIISAWLQATGLMDEQVDFDPRLRHQQNTWKEKNCERDWCVRSRRLFICPYQSRDPLR